MLIKINICRTQGRMFTNCQHCVTTQDHNNQTYHICSSGSNIFRSQTAPDTPTRGALFQHKESQTALLQVSAARVVPFKIQ